MNSTAIQHDLTSTAPLRAPLPIRRARTDANVQAPGISWTNADIRGAQSWFLLSVASLIFAGLFALFLVVGRLPFIAPFITDAAFFKRCLVIHVNLSLLV